MQSHKARGHLELHTRIAARIQNWHAFASPRQHTIHPGIIIAYASHYILSTIIRAHPITKEGFP